MNVDQLRKALADLPDDMPVVLSKDGEGNAFSPWSGDAALERYIAESEYNGFLVDHEDGNPDEGVPCIVLWPTN